LCGFIQHAKTNTIRTETNRIEVIIRSLSLSGLQGRKAEMRSVAVMFRLLP